MVTIGKDPSKWCVSINTNCEWKDVACREKMKVVCHHPRTGNTESGLNIVTQ